MASQLDELLASIAPQRTLTETAARADEAINSFRCDRAQLTDWDEFRRLLARFMLHVEGRCLRVPHLAEGHRVDLEFHWGRCVRILMHAYGANGEKAAFEMARTGNDGGLYEVLKKVAHAVADDFAEREVSAMVAQFWDRLSAEEQHCVCDQYLSQYGHLLPSELTEGNAARVRANMPKVLQEHPRLMQRLNRVGRA